MDTATVPLRHIRAAENEQDIAAAVTIVASAFTSLDATAWLVPEPAQRTTILRDVFTIVIEHAQLHGRVDLLIQPPAEGCADGSSAVGAAVWLYHDQPVPEPVDYDERLQQAAGPYTDHFRTLDLLFENHHPVRKHHYLAFLAALPEHQGAKVGSNLLLHHHAGLAALNMPSYLEAANPQTRELYLRNGYLPQGEPFELPNGARFFPMWRTPYAPGDER